MLSCIILTHNEAHNISAAITSVSFANQTIVIDDYSTDNTVSLAKKHGSITYQRHLNHDYAAQRNFGLAKASGDWILFLDADERISPALKQEILSTINPRAKSKPLNHPEVVAYYLKRQDHFLGRTLNHGENSHVKLLRLAKKGVGEWHRPVHETWLIKGPTAILSHPIIHHPHLSLSAFLTSVNRYTTIEAHYRHRRGQCFSFLKLIIYPPAKFILNYFIKFGFLDGFPGFIMAYIMSLHSLTVRIKLYETHHH